MNGPLAGLRVVEFASIGPGPHAAMLMSDLGTDVLVEGMRSDVLCASNPRLIYGRMTGWGQKRPWARLAGHDITYIALSGALAAMGKVGESAVVPRDLLGGAPPFYRCYLCSDGQEMAVGPLESLFFAAMMRLLGLERLIAAQYDGTRWGELTGALASTFASRPQPLWAKLFEGIDACVAPVLTARETPDYPHHVARHSSVEHDGLPQAAPSPRFSRTAGGIRASGDGEAMLQGWAGTCKVPSAN